MILLKIRLGIILVLLASVPAQAEEKSPQRKAVEDFIDPASRIGGHLSTVFYPKKENGFFDTHPLPTDPKQLDVYKIDIANAICNSENDLFARMCWNAVIFRAINSKSGDPNFKRKLSEAVAPCIKKSFGSKDIVGSCMNGRLPALREALLGAEDAKVAEPAGAAPPAQTTEGGDAAGGPAS